MTATITVKMMMMTIEGSCDDEKEESHQSKLDEMLAKFRTLV